MILGALLLADRLGRRLRDPVEVLAGAAERLGSGQLETRVPPSEIEELDIVGEAFNRLAPQLESLLIEERESLADLSHRLRTPLSALRLQSDSIANDDDRAALTQLVDRMEIAVDELIESMRRGEPTGECDAVAVVGDRVEFWAVLADEQRRPLRRDIAPGSLPVSLSSSQLESLVDILLGNVFDHTDPGVGFSVSLVGTGEQAILEIADAGPGLPDDLDVLERGESGAGSSGLGLDIARRLATDAGGTIDVGPGGGTGGLSVKITLPLTT